MKYTDVKENMKTESRSQRQKLIQKRKRKKRKKKRKKIGTRKATIAMEATIMEVEAIIIIRIVVHQNLTETQKHLPRKLPPCGTR